MLDLSKFEFPFVLALMTFTVVLAAAGVSYLRTRRRLRQEREGS